jgi:peptide/nickel transport system substrate-binding protein
LRNGDYDVVSLVPLNEAQAIDADPNLALEVAPAFRLDYVYLNHNKPPLDNKNIRLALNYAANREAILKVAYFGFGEIPNSYMPKINYHCESVDKIPYDIDKAKQLVAEAGYDGTPIEIMVDTGNSTFRQIATILQQGWQAAGLKIEINEYDVGTAWGNTETGNYQAYVSYITSDTNDQDFLASIQADYTGGTNAFFSHYKNDQVVEWLKQARQESDPEKRQALYCKIQQQVYWDGYSVPLNFKPFVNAYQNYVHGFRNLVTGPWWLKDVWLDK